MTGGDLGLEESQHTAQPTCCVPSTRTVTSCSGEVEPGGDRRREDGQQSQQQQQTGDIYMNCWRGSKETGLRTAATHRAEARKEGAHDVQRLDRRGWEGEMKQRAPKKAAAILQEGMDDAQ
mmetsp:Transcript_32051/g.48029  ORF Transcript_32051/g.48029 Transcript_32051/m.48029 type:complete len:121 (+) Transcript_32051:74-436(+)